MLTNLRAGKMTVEINMDCLSVLRTAAAQIVLTAFLGEGIRSQLIFSTEVNQILFV